jgi:hypothetical protein
MHSPEEFQYIRDNQSNRMGGLPLVGDPDSVARDMARLAAPIILRSGSAVLPICRVDDERVGRGRADGPGRDFPILAQNLLFAFVPKGGPRVRIRLPPAASPLRT